MLFKAVKGTDRNTLFRQTLSRVEESHSPGTILTRRTKLELKAALLGEKGNVC